MDNVANNLVKISIVSHTSGATSLVLGAAGSAFPATPFRITAVTGATYQTNAESLTIFGVTAVAVNTPSAGQCTLTVAVIEGSTDQAYTSSDYADCRITAGTISDIQAAVVSLQSAGYITSTGSTSGSAGSLNPGAHINGVTFNGSANITVPAAAGTLTGTALASNVVSSSLTSAAAGTFGSAAFVATTSFDAAGAAATAQSNAETYSANAANITSGTLAINVGGTAANTAYAAVTNLGLGVGSTIRRRMVGYGGQLGGQRGYTCIATLSNGTDPTTTFQTYMPFPGGAAAVRVLVHNIGDLPGVTPTAPNALQVSGAFVYPPAGTSTNTYGYVYPLQWNGQSSVTLSKLATAWSDWLTLPNVLPPAGYGQVRLTVFQGGSTYWPLGPPCVANNGTGSGPYYGDGKGITITAASNASPIVITTLGHHNFTTGMTALISGVNGNTAANGSFTVTYVSATTFSLQGSTGNGTFSYFANGSCIGSDLTLSGSGNTFGATGLYYIYSPMAVECVPVIDVPGVAVLGDSIAQGTGDSLQWPNEGYITRACSPNFPYMNMSQDGLSVYNMVSQYPLTTAGDPNSCRLTACRTGDYFITNLSINDITASRTLAQIQADLIAYWTGSNTYGQRAIQTTITPYTSSTNTWETVAAQSHPSATNETTRQNLNTWLRAGAPCTYSGYKWTATTVGAGGAITAGYYFWTGTAFTYTAGSGTHPAWAIIDPAALVEVNSSDAITLNGGYWITNGAAYYGTIDGTHPSAYNHGVMAASVPTSYMVAF